MPIIAALGGGPVMDVTLLRTVGRDRSKVRFFCKSPRVGAFSLKGAEGPLYFLREGFLTMRDALMRLLEPAVEALRFELVDLEFVQAGGGSVLRLYIDAAPREPGPGVSVDDCARVSHAVGKLLEAADPIKGRYSLEVSSPGVDRVLRKQAHFARFVGARVFVELRLPQDGRRRLLGGLRAVTDEAIVVEVDGREYRVPFERIQRARLRPE